MKFLINGDFGFPLGWPLFLAKLVYMWSFQSGAPNPDGIIRMPARLLYLAVFYLFGNLTYEYFYIFSSLVVLFLSFMLFTKHFLSIKDMKIRLLTSLVFTFNPVFLGNFSKLGLIFAVAMLPLSLICIKKAFATGSLRYLLFWAILLNVSLVHPYNFAINFGVTAVYFVILLRRQPSFIVEHWKKLLGLGVTIILLNAYFLLPIASMGTVSKDVLTSDGTPTDYTALVDVSNTGDILTGFSMSKNAFKDYEFYNGTYEALYFIGVFVVYAIIIVLFVLNQKNLTKSNRLVFVVTLVSLLLLVLLATVQVFSVGELIKKVVNLPGGWIFRSPLKWQLYIPFAFAVIMAVVLSITRNNFHKRLSIGGIIVGVILMNGFVGYQVVERLLIPRTLDYFTTLHAKELNNKNIAYVTSTDCRDYALNNPRVISELSQVFFSNNVQVRQIAKDDSAKVNLKNFDYVLTCQDSLTENTLESTGFTAEGQYAGKAFALYRNNQQPGYAYESSVYKVDKDARISPKIAGLNTASQKSKSLDFVSKEGLGAKGSGIPYITDPFENISFDNLSDGKVTRRITTGSNTDISLIKSEGSPSIYYGTEANNLSIASKSSSGLNGVSNGEKSLGISNAVNVVYDTPGYSYDNLVSNGSFEQGSWQKEVGKCFSGSPYSSVGMDIVQGASSNSSAVRLKAKQQVACISSSDIEVRSGQKYLVDFVYRSIDGAYAGYDISFGSSSSESRITKRLKQTKQSDGWVRETKEFVAPTNAKMVKITLYAYGGSNGVEGVASYDSFKMAAIPDISDKTFIVATTSTGKSERTGQNTGVQVNHDSPTSKTLTIRTSNDNPYITVKDSFSSHWRLGSGSAFTHIRNVSSLNVWRIDMQKYCKQNHNKCVVGANGYEAEVAMSFVPQRWFLIGMVISLMTAIGTVIYFILNRRDKSDTWKSNHVR